MRILITGSHGLVGSHLLPLLEHRKHEVVRLVRPSSQHDLRQPTLTWDPQANRLDPRDLERFDAVIHLAGENIAGQRWSEPVKRRLYDSRVHSTRLLAVALANLDRKPEVFLTASAVGYYGSRGDELLDEQSLPGRGFLADLCQNWEGATRVAADAGIRVVNTRLGVVLDPRQGALAKMLPPFKMGVGGRIGSGHQYMSWITAQDTAAALAFVLTHPQLAGPVNLVTPNPVSNREFTRTLGRVLRRPTFFPMPARIVRLVFGQMGDELLLASQRVQPAQLQSAGFQFAHNDLEPAVRALLRPRPAELRTP